MRETKEIIRRVKRIEIKTKHIVDGLIAGSYHSIFKGQGIEFSDIREYRPGDDIRAIDWKVTARFNRPFLKEFTEERDLRVYFVFDASGSNTFGNKTTKRRVAIELSASLMFGALRNNDNVGLFMVTDRVEKFIPARKGRRHIMRLIREMVTAPMQSRQTDLNKSLMQVSKILRRRSVVFIISDFFARGYLKPIKLLKKRNDVIALRVLDSREFEIPDIGLVELEDAETGEQLLLDTSDSEFRENYKRFMANETKRVHFGLKKARVSVIDIFTDESYEAPLRRFFRKRERGVIV